MFFALILSLFIAAAPVTGVVKDTTGGVVSGATVTVQSGAGAAQAVTGPDGRFAIENAPDGDATILVRAGGFAEQRQRLGASRDLEIVLSPAGVLETVTVTPTRTEQRLGDVPASVDILTSEEIKASPAVMADDVLRQVPAFSLFRRASSVSSHPTTQGVSLRGIGPSGVSRTLVLLDSVPFNDPFGGWVYWTRVPLGSVDRIEITEDTSSSLYGNYAMGGVINIVTSRPMRRTIELSPQYGSRTSPKLDFLGSNTWRKVGATVEGSVFKTDGFPNVAAKERGPIDINADVKYQNISAKLEFRPSDRVDTFFRGGYFSEDRTNAKIGEVNDTRSSFVNGGTRMLLADGSDLQARVFVDHQKFHSTFLAVTNSTAARNLVRLSVDQHVPTNSVGGMVQWSKSIGMSNVLSAGADWRWVDGDSNEDSYNAVAPQTVIANPAPWASLTPVTIQAALALARVSGGTQQTTGAFVQDIFTVAPKLTVTLSARVDHWRNYAGHNLETALIAGTVVNNQPSLVGRTDTVGSPHAAALYHFSDRISGWAAVSSGFRAPTLNELYRQFRQGTTLVLANNQLGAERLVGGEAGINVAPIRNLSWRTTWFDDRVRNPVSNVTLTQVGANVTQQRQNLGKTRIWGVQTDVDYRLGTALKVSGAYIYDHATVTDGGAANAALVDKFLPQVPKNRGSLQLAYTSARYANLAVTLQFVGRQFDDDQNVRVVPAATLTDAGYDASTAPGLPGYTTMDIMASRTLRKNIEVFAGVQNLLDKEYFVGTLPTTTGSPRQINGGVRVRFSGR